MVSGSQETELMGELELIKYPSSRIEKLVIVSEPRRELSALVAINHEPMNQVAVLRLSTLKRTGMHGPSAIPGMGETDMPMTRQQLSRWKPWKRQ